MCLTGLGCTGKKQAHVTVYIPDGAPAVAMAGMLAQDTNTDGVEYRVVLPSGDIKKYVTYKEQERNADICVLPLTAASKLLGDGERYALLGTLTHGNLYLVAKSGEYTSQNVTELIGKRVGVIQINEVPGMTFKAVLSSYGIPYAEVKNEGGMVEDKVNLYAIQDATAVATSGYDCYLLPEPAATLQKKNGYAIVGDLQALYGEGKGYPQAVLVARRSFAEERKEWLQEFVGALAGSLTWVKAASGEEIVAAVSSHLEDKSSATSLKAPALTSEVVGRCGIRFTYAIDEKGAIEGHLAALKAVSPQQVGALSEKFYWDYSK